VEVRLVAEFEKILIVAAKAGADDFLAGCGFIGIGVRIGKYLLDAESAVDGRLGWDAELVRLYD
jgi:hypothetical protein